MEYDTIYTFLRGALKDKPSFTITTDHRREYKRIMDDLKVKHQLCIFHLFKMIGKDVYDASKSKKLSYRDKIKLCLYFTKIKEIFRTYDEYIAIERLESLFDKYDDIPLLLQAYIQKKILPDL